MIALMFAVALFIPGPGDPVCEAGQSVQVDHCAQGQLPGEVVGREIDEPSAPSADPAAIVLEATTPIAVTPAPARHLAHTGVPMAPYLVASGVLIGAGVLLRRRATVTTTARSAD